MLIEVDRLDRRRQDFNISFNNFSSFFFFNRVWLSRTSCIPRGSFSHEYSMSNLSERRWQLALIEQVVRRNARTSLININ